MVESEIQAATERVYESVPAHKPVTLFHRPERDEWSAAIGDGSTSAVGPTPIAALEALRVKVETDG